VTETVLAAGGASTIINGKCSLLAMSNLRSGVDVCGFRCAGPGVK
jgi:hypothetical protein